MEELGYQVFLTTHNDKTVAYLDTKVAEPRTEASCFIMSCEDGLVKITKYNESLGAKLLLDNFYITMIKTQPITVKQQQDLIINFNYILGTDFSMESLVKTHTKEMTPGCLRFLNKICQIVGRDWEKDDVEVIDSVKNLYYKENEGHPLKDFLTAENNNSKVKIVWPTDKKNESFDSLFLFSVVDFQLRKKKNAVFCQITVSKNLDKKISKTFKQTFKKHYSLIIEQMNNAGIEVKYILIHGNGDMDSRDDHIEQYNMNTIMYNVDCYSFWSLGKAEIFDDDAMRKLYELKNN